MGVKRITQGWVGEGGMEREREWAAHLLWTGACILRNAGTPAWYLIQLKWPCFPNLPGFEAQPGGRETHAIMHARTQARTHTHILQANPSDVFSVFTPTLLQFSLCPNCTASSLSLTFLSRAPSYYAFTVTQQTTRNHLVNVLCAVSFIYCLFLANPSPLRIKAACPGK